ncbi:MAG: HEPN domain-containing protein [archaeon]
MIKADFEEWIKFAEEDLETASYNINGGKTGAGLFFLQQCAEKSLKAVYMKRFENMFRTHDLVLLAKKLNVPNAIMKYCKELNPAYLYTRYPDVPEVKNLNEMGKNLHFYAKEILKWAKKNT